MGNGETGGQEEESRRLWSAFGHGVLPTLWVGASASMTAGIAGSRNGLGGETGNRPASSSTSTMGSNFSATAADSLPDRLTVFVRAQTSHSPLRESATSSTSVDVL